MISCTANECFLSSDNYVLTYCRSVVPDSYAYAINVVGKECSSKSYIIIRI